VVTAGYHLSKRHWNTVTLDGSVPDNEVLELIGHTYDLVVAHLTKAQQSKPITRQPIRGRGHPPATRDRVRTTDRCRTWTGRRYRPYDPGGVRSVSMRFTDYSFGSIQVDGVTYDHDLVIDRGKIRKRKKAASRRFRGAYGHTPLSAAEDIPWRCRRLVIGTGADSALPVLRQVREEARRRKIDLVVLPTAEAIGVLGQTTKATNAILHLTC
jgi:hypothetical protein